MVFHQAFIISSLALSALLVIAGIIWPVVKWAWLVIGPLIALGIRDLVQNKHTLLKIYPVVGHFRYLFESVRRELQQYFVESDLDGAPVNREFRSLLYQRAKKDNDTRAFGTIFDVYRNGYEWVNHSLAPKECLPVDLRVTFGGPECTRPYEASPLNISAMSYGALSRNAVMALFKFRRPASQPGRWQAGGSSSESARRCWKPVCCLISLPWTAVKEAPERHRWN